VHELYKLLIVRTSSGQIVHPLVVADPEADVPRFVVGIAVVRCHSVSFFC